MAGQWYVKVSGKRAGPFSWERLKGLAQKGQFSPDDLVRQEGKGPWVPAGQVKGLFGDGGSPAGGSEASSRRVAGPLKGPGGQSGAKPLPTAKPISKPKPAGRAKSAAVPLAKPLDEPPAEAGATPPAATAAEDSATQAPEVAGNVSTPPELPALGPRPSEPSVEEFALAIDSFTGGRKIGPRARQARRKNNTIIAAAFAVMLLAVLAVGAVLTRSNRVRAKPAPPADASGAAPAAAVEGRLPEGPEVPDVEDLEAIDDLEALDIFGSAGAERGPSGDKPDRSQENRKKK